jgi:hypothetical protein
VIVSFDRRIAPGSVQAADFTFNNDLEATAAEISEANPREVVVTTETQIAQFAYTVTVAGLTDTLDRAIEEEGGSGSFVGFGDVEVDCADGEDNDADGDTDCEDTDCAEAAACDFPEVFISELDPQNPGDDTLEFIEVRNNSGAAIDLAVQGWYLMLVNGNGDVTYDVIQLGPGTIAAGDVWVVGSSTVAGVDQTAFTTNGLQNGVDGVLLARCDACAGATDFSGDGSGYDPGTEATFTSDSGREGTKVDAVAYENNANDPDDTGLWSKLIGVTQQFNENLNGTAETESLHRTSVAGWLLGALTPGD